MENKKEAKVEARRETKKEIKQQSRTLLILALFLLVAVTAGVSYAFFTYTRLGTTENTITTGTITFLYDEKEALGNGISITDAYPMSDDNGVLLTGANNVFDFKVLATATGNANIPYEVTARKKATSDDIDSNVKLYLTEVTSDSETAAPLTVNNDVVRKFSELTQTNTAVGDGIVEKTIYRDTVPANSTDYEKNFRLRMWISDDTDFSGVVDEEGNTNYPMNDKTFTVTVNVYANATVVSAGNGE